MQIPVFLGSVRDTTPPNPPRLGLRVARACIDHMRHHHPDMTPELVDPLDYDLGGVFKPHFAYAQGKVPEPLEALGATIAGADGYVMISPEYNHCMSPALAHLLNHFGSSLFSYKPSLIVTYSAGQWGGARAAVTMRTFLSELGCLPVSALLQIPAAQQVFDEEGVVRAGAHGDDWARYFGRAFTQLAWWAEATRSHRQTSDPHARIQAFRRDPSQRNAP